MQLLTKNNLLQTDFSVKTQWDQGFTGRLDIFNPGETIQDWTLEFESPFEIEPSMIWGAEIVSHEGDRYVLEPLDYNETINSQQEISVFFNANKVNGQIIKPKNISFGDDSSSVIDASVEDTPEPVTDVPATDNSSVIEAPVEDTPEPVTDVPATNSSSVIDSPVEDTPEPVTDVPATDNSSVIEAPVSVIEAPVEDTPEPVTDVLATDNSSVIEDLLAENTSNSDTATTPDDQLSADFDFTLIDDWGSGFQGKISITNNSGSNIDSWSLEFDFPNQINNIWDAEIESNKDGSYVITNAAWNREIAAGETLTFGFTGNNSVTSEPQNFELNGSTFSSLSTSDSIYTFSNPDLEAELELNQNYQGRATFYDAANPSGGKGNSGYDVPVQSELEKVVAINNVQWNGSEASGAFLEVSGPAQRDGAAPIIVQVVDHLYERADGLDMSAEAFAKVADPVDGIVNIDYKLVGPADDYVTAYGYSIGQGIVLEGIDGTNPYYAAVRLNNHRYPIESVDLITNDGNLVDLNRESDNRFVLNGNYPLNDAQDLLVTDIFGQEVTLDDVNITNGSSADIVTGEQFDMIS